MLTVVRVVVGSAVTVSAIAMLMALATVGDLEALILDVAEILSATASANLLGTSC